MTLDQKLRQASAEVRHSVAGRRGHPITGVAHKRRLSRLSMAAVAAAATLVTVGIVGAVLRSDPVSPPVGTEPSVSTTATVEPTSSPTTVPVAIAPTLTDLPRFNIALDGWFLNSAVGAESFLFTSFEIAGTQPLAHMADIEIWRNNSGPTPFTSYEEHLAASMDEGEHLGTVTLANGVTAEAFYFPNPGLYHDFIWQHSDSIWVVARIHTSTYGEANRADAFGEAERVASSIKPISEEIWSELVAESPIGYWQQEYPGEPFDPSAPPLMPGKRGTPETTTWNDWVTDAMQTIGFEIEWIDTVELEGADQGRVQATVRNPDGDDWLLAYAPWFPGEYSDDIEAMYEHWGIDEPGKATPEGIIIIKDMRPNSILVHLWMGEAEGHITILAERGDGSSAPPLDPDLLEALARTATPTVRQLLGTDPSE